MAIACAFLLPPTAKARQHACELVSDRGTYLSSKAKLWLNDTKGGEHVHMLNTWTQEETLFAKSADT